MATVNLFSAFDANNFWSARSGPLTTGNPTTYQFQNAAGYTVIVSGTGFTFGGDDPTGGNYTDVFVYTDNTFTNLVATYNSASAIDLGTYFSSGLSTALASTS